MDMECDENGLVNGNLHPMNSSLLRKLMLLDAAVLLWLGLFLICFPGRVETAFGFGDLPPGVDYILGLWGSVMATMGLGYAFAAREPACSVLWVQMGIGRGALECFVGLIFLAQGVVTWRQASVGIVLAGLLSAAYLVLYPRRKVLAQPAAS
jgi:hypothetical protein